MNKTISNEIIRKFRPCYDPAAANAAASQIEKLLTYFD